MKIGVFTADFKPDAGGTATFSGDILNALISRDNRHQYYIFYYGDSEEQRSPPGKNVFLKVLPKPSGRREKFFSPWLMEKSIELMANLTPKALSPIQQVSPLQQMVSECRIELMWYIYGYEEVAVPFIYTVLDLEHRKHPFFPEVSLSGNTWQEREEFYANILPKAAYIITGTEEGKKEIRHFYRMIDERIRVIPFPTPTYVLNSPVPDEKMFQELDITSPYLFYPAQFWPHKNHVNLLRALHTLKHEYKLDFPLLLTGSDKGNLAHIKEVTDQLGLNENVHYLGFVSQEKLIHLYRNAFALPFLSFFGPDNLPPLEAFALQCPVIAADISGARDFLGDAALFADPGNPGDIARKVKSLYDDVQLRQTLISRGRERARQWTTDDYIHAIDSLIRDFETYRRCWSSSRKYTHL